MFKFSKLAPLAAAALTLAGCGHVQAPTATPASGKALAERSAGSRMVPVINYVTANGMMGNSFVVPPNYPVRFDCYAFGDGFLSYDWRSYQTIFNYGAMATWTSPPYQGTYDIQVWVRDQYGVSTFRDIWMQVQPQAAKLAASELSQADQHQAKKPTAANSTVQQPAPVTSH